MAFILETGAGLTDADMLINRDFAKAQLDALGFDQSPYTDAQIDEGIVRVSRYLTHSIKWKGYKVNGRSQAMAFPQTGLVDGEGNSVPSDEVPDEVELAAVELLRHELKTPFGLFPSYVPSERVKSETVGSISITYDTSRLDAGAVRMVVVALADLIGPFVKSSGGLLSGQAVRG